MDSWFFSTHINVVIYINSNDLKSCVYIVQSPLTAMRSTFNYYSTVYMLISIISVFCTSVSSSECSSLAFLILFSFALLQSDYFQMIAYLCLSLACKYTVCPGVCITLTVICFSLPCFITVATIKFSCIHKYATIENVTVIRGVTQSECVSQKRRNLYGFFIVMFSACLL